MFYWLDVIAEFLKRLTIGRVYEKTLQLRLRVVEIGLDDGVRMLLREKITLAFLSRMIDWMRAISPEKDASACSCQVVPVFPLHSLKVVANRYHFVRALI